MSFLFACFPRCNMCKTKFGIITQNQSDPLPFCSGRETTNHAVPQIFDISFPLMRHTDRNFYLFSIQFLSHVQCFVTPWTAACQASLSITNSQSLLKLMSIKSVMPSTISSSVVPFYLFYSLNISQIYLLLSTTIVTT